MLFAVGQSSPTMVEEGLRIHYIPPLALMIGIPTPATTEMRAINQGTIFHRFGSNDQTSWMTLHFCLQGRIIFMGEVFYSAALIDEEEYQSLIANDIPENVGLACVVVVVDTTNQKVTVTRAYGLSQEISLAFLAAAKKTRQVAPQDVQQASRDLLGHSTWSLANMAQVTFVHKGL